MNPAISMTEVRSTRRAAGEEAVSWLTGAGFTFAIFLCLAHFENSGSAGPVVVIEDLRMVATLLEPPPPPPKIEERTEAPKEALPFAGLEVGASDSPVSIAVVPPDLESLIPTTSSAVNAKIQFGLLHTELKPRADIDVDVRHVYQTAEVDQKPRPLVRTAPSIPSDVRGSALTLRVGLLLVIGTDGKPESTRVMESSGNARFDALVVRTVQSEWLFSPATRRGTKVRVLAQQAFRVNFSSNSSPFSISR